MLLYFVPIISVNHKLHCVIMVLYFHFQLIKSLVSSVLIVHGKLYTKIGYVILSSLLPVLSVFNRLERITDAVEKCLSNWRLVLHHQLSVNDTSRFMKMLILCFFSLHNVAEREQGKWLWLYDCSCFVCRIHCSMWLFTITSVPRQCPINMVSINIATIVSSHKILKTFIRYDFIHIPCSCISLMIWISV